MELKFYDGLKIIMLVIVFMLTIDNLGGPDAKQAIVNRFGKYFQEKQVSL